MGEHYEIFVSATRIGLRVGKNKIKKLWVAIKCNNSFLTVLKLILYSIEKGLIDFHKRRTILTRDLFEIKSHYSFYQPLDHGIFD